MTSAVARPIAASSEKAVLHFSALLEYETDCWDVQHAIVKNKVDFVLLDVRGEELFRNGHLPESESFPHFRMNVKNLSIYPPETLFVVYCAGPHCNGADKAAIKLAKLNRPVKKMIGGVTDWLDEGFGLIGFE